MIVLVKGSSSGRGACPDRIAGRSALGLLSSVFAAQNRFLRGCLVAAGGAARVASFVWNMHDFPGFVCYLIIEVEKRFPPLFQTDLSFCPMRKTLFSGVRKRRAGIS